MKENFEVTNNASSQNNGVDAQEKNNEGKSLNTDLLSKAHRENQMLKTQLNKALLENQALGSRLNKALLENQNLRSLLNNTHLENERLKSALTDANGKILILEDYARNTTQICEVYKSILSAENSHNNVSHNQIQNREPHAISNQSTPNRQLNIPRKGSQSSQMSRNEANALGNPCTTAPAINKPSDEGLLFQDAALSDRPGAMLASYARGIIEDVRRYQGSLGPKRQKTFDSKNINIINNESTGEERQFIATPSGQNSKLPYSHDPREINNQSAHSSYMNSPSPQASRSQSNFFGNGCRNNNATMGKPSGGRPFYNQHEMNKPSDDGLLSHNMPLSDRLDARKSRLRASYAQEIINDLRSDQVVKQPCPQNSLGLKRQETDEREYRLDDGRGLFEASSNSFGF